MIAALAATVFLGLALSVTPVKTEVTLGEPVELRVTLTNGEVRSRQVPEPVFDSGSLWIRFATVSQERAASFARRLDKGVAVTTLASGASMTATVTWTPVRAGEWGLVVAYSVDNLFGQARIRVKPAPNGATELGWRLETTKGPLTVRFLPDAAPNHVAHFAELARTGFFNGLGFHRVIKGFMAQGGDPLGTGDGGPGYTLPAEFTRKEQPKHRLGTVSTARDESPDSGGSQFFICFADVPRLDGKYTVFGELADGFDTLKAIEAIGAEKAPKPELEGKPGEIVKITRSSLVPLSK